MNLFCIDFIYTCALYVYLLFLNVLAVCQPFDMVNSFYKVALIRPKYGAYTYNTVYCVLRTVFYTPFFLV